MATQVEEEKLDDVKEKVEEKEPEVNEEKEPDILEPGEMPWIGEPTETPIIPPTFTDVEDIPTEEAPADAPVSPEGNETNELPISQIVPEENETPAIPIK